MILSCYIWQVETERDVWLHCGAKNIVVSTVPVAEFTPPIICVNDVNAPFVDASTGNVTAGKWNFGRSKANAGNPNTSTFTKPAHHYTQPGTFTAQLIATNAAGLEDTIPHTVICKRRIIDS